MRILVLHNRYKHIGGEEAVVAGERALLQSHGHEVRILESDNRDIEGVSAKMRAAASALYSVQSRDRTSEAISDFRPDVVHAHNLFPTLSPSVYYACRETHVPVVQTLHNYRLVCPGAMLMRDGTPCEECVGKSFALGAVRHGCFKNSKVGSLVGATSAFLHKTIGTYSTQVQRYIALTEFARGRFIAGGLPAEKIDVKSNFLDPDPGAGAGDGGFVLFVGRLSHEKGINVLLRAWRNARHNVPLKIIGSGPMEQLCRDEAGQNPLVEYLGPKPKHDVLTYLGSASAMVFPSVWYEGFPMVMVEAFSRGTPVISSKLGSMAEIVRHGENGLHFASGDAISLHEQVLWLDQHGAEIRSMRHIARSEFELKYSARTNYEQLIAVYERAIARN